MATAATKPSASVTPSRFLDPNPSPVASLYIPHSNIACDNSGQIWVRSGVRIKLVDKKGRSLVSAVPECCFSDIALTPSGDILIPDYVEKGVWEVSRNGNIKLLWYDTRKPHALCCLSNGDVIVTYWYHHHYPGSVVMKMSSKGWEIKEYDKIKFRWVSRVKASKVNTDIYILDRDKSDEENQTGRILALGEDGQLHFEYNGQGNDKFNPLDVCADEMGHILITEIGNNRVYILDQNGHFIQYIQTPKSARYLDVDREGYLWVGQKDGPIQVYKYLSEEAP